MDFTITDEKRISLYGIVRFRSRMQKHVFIHLSSQLQRVSKLCRTIMVQFSQSVNSGLVNIHARSDFKTRNILKDKQECVIILTKDIKDWIEKISFSEKISQSEVLRMAIEWWIEHHKKNMRVSPKNKWSYIKVSLRVEEFDFSFWKYARNLTLSFPKPSDLLLTS